MSLDKKQLLGIVMKNLDISGLLADLLDEVLEPVLKKFVADTANPYDDMLLAAIYPVLEKELKEKLKELIDDLLKDDEVVA